MFFGWIYYSSSDPDSTDFSTNPSNSGQSSSPDPSNSDDPTSSEGPTTTIHSGTSLSPDPTTGGPKTTPTTGGPKTTTTEGPAGPTFIFDLAAYHYEVYRTTTKVGSLHVTSTDGKVDPENVVYEWGNYIT